ncbi:PDZ domain-containing protein [Mucilaginibacter antarcticus]|uniref:PDZ domain-containing protein n=2 Tax=Mucilaginibacter antarcticus TaxID=1855725 RepID=A0ABW5XSM8_9SPHI
MVDTLPRTGVLSANYVNLPNKSGVGFIGATTALKDDKLVVNQRLPGGAADISGMKTNDLIDAVADVRVEDELDLVKSLRKLSAGDTVAIKGSRNGNSFSKLTVLKYPPQKLSNHPATILQAAKV